MVIQALVGSLRPPDRYPPRLATLDPDQEAVVRFFLQALVGDAGFAHVAADAAQALEEWWLPGAHSRPTPEEVARLRAIPEIPRVVDGGVYRLSIPERLTGSGSHAIPQESRRVETFGGPLCGDADTVVAINVTPLDLRPLPAAVARVRALLRDGATSASVVVRGSSRAARLDGYTAFGSPAEPQRLTTVFATAAADLVALSIRSWPRDDVDQQVERIVSSFEIVKS